MTALTAEELQTWVERTEQGWQNLIKTHPAILSFPCDVRETNTVAELLQHIVAVELRYAQRLHGLSETPYEDILYDSAAAIDLTHKQAMAMIRELKDHGPDFWEQEIDFATRSAGVLQVSRRTVLVHLFMHSIRHYAQLATLVRQHGIKPDWPMDYLFMQFQR